MSNHLYDALFLPHRDRDAPFLTLADGRLETFRDFLDRSARIAHVITQLGVAPGDRLAVQVAKSPEALSVYVACVQAGVIFLPLNTAYTASEVDYFVGDATPKILVCDQKAQPALEPVAKAHGARLMTLNADGSGSLMEAADKAPANFQTCARGRDDLAAFLYTSGTTGRSKGAMLTQDNLLSNARALTDYWQFTGADVLLHALPIFHTHGLFVASNICFLAGASMIFLPSFKADQMIAFLPHATTMMGVPTFYTRLLDEAAFTKDLVSHMRLFVSGSAPLLEETHIAFEARTGHRILERYGMTETNMNTSNPYDGERRAGTVGFPLPGVDLRVADAETGKVLPQGEIGVIEVRGPNVFKGYWNMAEKTAEEFRADGYFITGDVGQVDDRGYVRIVGRAKDLIISGGYNIYPKEIELLLDEEDGVLESAVIGVPHPDFGEGVVGVLVPQKGVTLDPDAILSSIAPKIARFKQPKALFIHDELPRNTMGKVQKNVLRETYKDQFKI
ncbi:malonate--CoA ligase [Hwanghaeella sp. 1Z406]|jgi:malonyl-CoA/methylmalonyl-CoA synthetase|uniref:malonate--CoA ligase n=1 Tax=Hwanghaeella sp. 1Z406 TaxID=3402811 RepID=UPI003B6755E6|tara:strand:+ start:92155 stop:93669 length:1515 start_codon:yes stop_codon:yes gene_type:complete